MNHTREARIDLLARVDLGRMRLFEKKNQRWRLVPSLMERASHSEKDKDCKRQLKPMDSKERQLCSFEQCHMITVDIRMGAKEENLCP